MRKRKPGRPKKTTARKSTATRRKATSKRRTPSKRKAAAKTYKKVKRKISNVGNVVKRKKRRVSKAAKKVYRRVKRAAPKANVKQLLKLAFITMAGLGGAYAVKKALAPKTRGDKMPAWIPAAVPAIMGLGLYFGTKWGKKGVGMFTAGSLLGIGAWNALPLIPGVDKWFEKVGMSGMVQELAAEDVNFEDPEQVALLGEEIADYAEALEGQDIESLDGRFEDIQDAEGMVSMGEESGPLVDTDYDVY